MSETTNTTNADEAERHLLDVGTTYHRAAPADLAITEGEDGSLEFSGHAAVFDVLSDEVAPNVREVIDRGAFRKVLSQEPDVLMLWNHDFHQPLARSTVKEGPGSLQLEEDTKGLHVRGRLVRTRLAEDVRELVRSGVVQGMSFGFRVGRAGSQSIIRDGDGKGYIRRIHSFSKLIDVSPTPNPAYPHTAFAVRSVCGVELIPEEESAIRELSWRIFNGEVDVDEEQRAALDVALATLNTVSPWTMERALRAAAQEPELRAVVPGHVATVTLEPVAGDEPVAWRVAARRRKLALAERTMRGAPCR